VHGLRHTNASVMLSIGITTKMAMARGGWSNQKTMQDIYQHLFSEDKNEAAIKIDEYFESLMNPAKK
jgi:integrase